LRFTISPEVFGSDTLPLKICPSASTTVRWQENTWCHQHVTLMLVEIWWSQLPSSWHQCHVAIRFFLWRGSVLCGVELAGHHSIEKFHTANVVSCAMIHSTSRSFQVTSAAVCC